MPLHGNWLIWRWPPIIMFITLSSYKFVLFLFTFSSLTVKSKQGFLRIYKSFFPHGDPAKFASLVFRVFDENKVSLFCLFRFGLFSLLSIHSHLFVSLTSLALSLSFRHAIGLCRLYGRFQFVTISIPLPCSILFMHRFISSSGFILDSYLPLDFLLFSKFTL